ncbi:hypothetical protein BJ742DRAFT_738618 [Cladochytrium replicatum]|nr:hypothetical protein BJ742DRAFT_738618 [Cladochytrium replicatum]
MSQLPELSTRPHSGGRSSVVSRPTSSRLSQGGHRPSVRRPSLSFIRRRSAWGPSNNESSSWWSHNAEIGSAVAGRPLEISSEEVPTLFVKERPDFELMEAQHYVRILKEKQQHLKLGYQDQQEESYAYTTVPEHSVSQQMRRRRSSGVKGTENISSLERKESTSRISVHSGGKSRPDQRRVSVGQANAIDALSEELSQALPRASRRSSVAVPKGFRSPPSPPFYLPPPTPPHQPSTTTPLPPAVIVPHPIQKVTLVYHPAKTKGNNFVSDQCKWTSRELLFMQKHTGFRVAPLIEYSRRRALCG